jgi:hypothetical protein
MSVVIVEDICKNNAIKSATGTKFAVNYRSQQLAQRRQGSQVGPKTAHETGGQRRKIQMQRREV